MTGAPGHWGPENSPIRGTRHGAVKGLQYHRMPHPEFATRLVLDTNVWLDWLVFADAGVAPIRCAVTGQRAIVFLSAACRDELARVLGYPLSGRALNVAAQTAALAQCDAVACVTDNFAEPHRVASLPRCADPDDQKFLELARDCRADALITKDGALLALAARNARPLPFRILTPRDYAHLCIARDSRTSETGMG